MCVLIFSTTFAWNIYPCKKHWASYVGLFVKCPLFLSDFNESCIFSRKNFEKYADIKFYEKPSCSLRTDRHEKATGRLSQFCKSV